MGFVRETSDVMAELDPAGFGPSVLEVLGRAAGRPAARASAASRDVPKSAGSSRASKPISGARASLACAPACHAVSCLLTVTSRCRPPGSSPGPVVVASWSPLPGPVR